MVCRDPGPPRWAQDAIPESWDPGCRGRPSSPLARRCTPNWGACSGAAHANDSDGRRSGSARRAGPAAPAGLSRVEGPLLRTCQCKLLKTGRPASFTLDQCRAVTVTATAAPTPPVPTVTHRPQPNSESSLEASAAGGLRPRADPRHPPACTPAADGTPASDRPAGPARRRLPHREPARRRQPARPPHPIAARARSIRVVRAGTIRATR
jgi:hypothetical protein